MHQGKEKEEREKQRAKAEVDRLKGLVGGTSSTSSSSPAPPAAKPRVPASAPQASAADRKKQIAQLAEMGIAVPDKYRSEFALAGEWQTMAQRHVCGAQSTTTEPLSVGVRKRKLEEGEEGEEGGDAETATSTAVRRGWGSTTKTYPGAASSSQLDLDDLLAGHTLPKKETPSEEKVGTGNVVKEEVSSIPAALEQDDDKAAVKKEIDALEGTGASQTQTEAANSAPGIVFKKRKARPAKDG